MPVPSVLLHGAAHRDFHPRWALCVLWPLASGICLMEGVHEDQVRAPRRLSTGYLGCIAPVMYRGLGSGTWSLFPPEEQQPKGGRDWLVPTGLPQARLCSSWATEVCLSEQLALTRVPSTPWLSAEVRCFL